MDRDQQVQEIRLELGIEENASSSKLEQFMHRTLRPILKFQNDTLLASIKQAPHFSHLKLVEEQEKNNRTLLKVFLHKNKGLRHQLLGVISGLFTAEELTYYFENAAELNKRITEMVITRFISQWGES